MQIEPVHLLIAAGMWLSGVLGSWAAIRVTLGWHRQEIERAHKRLDEHDHMLMDSLRRTGL